MKIKVTKKDIDRAKRLVQKIEFDSCNYCPIALAVKRKTHKVTEVTRYGVSLHTLAKWTEYALPLEAAVFITKFDREEEVHPIEFEMSCRRG